MQSFGINLIMHSGSRGAHPRSQRASSLRFRGSCKSTEPVFRLDGRRLLPRGGLAAGTVCIIVVFGLDCDDRG
jgi:hypothetical protein